MLTTKRLHFKIEGLENGLVATGGQNLSGLKWRKKSSMETFMLRWLETGIKRLFIKMGLYSSMISLFT
jgi:hypothetical protein